jgi:hypothetical protein
MVVAAAAGDGGGSAPSWSFLLAFVRVLRVDGFWAR